MPAAREWFRLMLVHAFGKQAMGHCRFQEEDAANAAPDMRNLDERGRVQIEVGVKLRNGRKWMNDSLTCFRLCLLGCVSKLTERVVYLLFSTEAVKEQVPKRSFRRKRKKAKKAPEPEPEADDEKSMYNLINVMNAVETLELVGAPHVPNG